MATNDATIVGPPRCMILFKPPAEPKPEHRQLLSAVDIVGIHKDGYFLATCWQDEIPRLREAEAEVIVLDADANRFAARTRDMGEEQYLAMVDARADEARQELALADRGGSRGGDSTA